MTVTGQLKQKCWAGQVGEDGNDIVQFRAEGNDIQSSLKQKDLSGKTV